MTERALGSFVVVCGGGERGDEKKNSWRSGRGNSKKFVQRFAEKNQKKKTTRLNFDENAFRPNRDAVGACLLRGIRQDARKRSRANGES